VSAPETSDQGPLARAPAERAQVDVPEWARRLARLLDSAIVIPGTDFRIGLDPILGLVLPELGDALTAVLALTLLGVAWQQRVPKVVLARMLMNIAIDAVLGAIPLLGDAFDFAFRANEKNLELIERHRGDTKQKPTWADRLLVGGVMLLALSLLLVPIALSILLLRHLLR
jgi:hypothetical protein